MRLRKRLSDQLKARLLATLPQAVETVWDHVAVVVAVEQITFTSAGGHEGDWERATEFKGLVMAELRADAIDSLEVEPLIADLVAKRIFLEFPQDAESGMIAEKARVTLADWRDVIRDQDVASKLRFNVEGVIARKDTPAMRPEFMMGAAPEIGPEHEDAYTSITEITGGAA